MDFKADSFNIFDKDWALLTFFKEQFIRISDRDSIRRQRVSVIIIFLSDRAASP